MAEQTTVPPSSEPSLLPEIEDCQCVERELQQKTRDLGERFKELSCLYTISALLQETGLSLDEVVRRTVRSLVAAYRYSDIACARSVIEGREYRTDNFRETPWKQAVDIAVNGVSLGKLEVCYLEERPQGEGPFLKEERDLLNAVAALLGRIIKDRRARDALVQSEARFRRVVELVPDILYQVTLPTYRAVFVSPAIETLLGFTPEEWLAGEDSWQRQLHEDDKARVRPELDELIGRRTDILSVEYRMWHKDGKTLRWFADRLYVERDAHGVPISAFGIMSDITERKRMEEMLRTLNAELERRVAERTAQLEAAVRELEGISYTVSHDLRAPVRAVDGFASILLEDYRHTLDTEGTRLLQVIRDNTKKMGWMIDAILDFLQLGRATMVMAGIDMDGLARTVVQELKPMARRRVVRIKIRPMPPARGDRAMIHRVMANLVANALKFTRPKETAYIEIGGKAEEKENIYYVKDNGVGFDMRYAGKLFGIFQRLHGMEEFEGTGIGLAIVHRIVVRHGGRVWAEGKVNAGATFYFALPRI